MAHAWSSEGRLARRAIAQVGTLTAHGRPTTPPEALEERYAPMASQKRKRPDGCDDATAEAVEAYIMDLKGAIHIFDRSAGSAGVEPGLDTLVTDETWDAAEGSRQVGRAQNVRTILALAEGVRLRRLDAASRA